MYTELVIYRTEKCSCVTMPQMQVRFGVLCLLVEVLWARPGLGEAEPGLQLTVRER